MGKKILYILVAGMLIFGILFLLWSFFFNGTTKSPFNSGQFGTASDTNQTSGTNIGTSGNGEIGLGQAGNGQNASNGSIPLNGNGGAGGGTNGTGGTNGAGSNGAGSSGAGSSGAGSQVNSGGATIGVPGAVWLNGSLVTNSASGTGAGGGGNTNGFTPTGINGVNGGTIGGTVPTIGGNVSNPNNPNSTINSLIATGLIGAASCALQAGISAASTGSASAATAGAAGVVSTATGAPFGSSPGPNIVADYGVRYALTASYGLQTANAAKNAGKENLTFVNCITNTLAKVALQQITASVVNWINSGFNGQPSFVTNYQQFFTNVADLAAGQFIQGAGLSFLCSPFKLQIKIAIAQSYANRSAQSCSLTGIIKNIDGFMNGNFSQGGWPGLLSFTTVPSNNPYGAYSYAQVGLVSAQNSALNNAKNNISPTGFLNLQQQTCSGNTTVSGTIGAGLNSQAAKVSCPPGCSCKVTTPGGIIESTLQSTLKSPIDQLGIGNSIDQILNALTNQLITKTLQGGLSNLSGTTGLQNNYQTPAEAAAQAQAQTILASLQANGAYAAQVGSILQGSIGDIESAQNQLNSLSNCWIVVASSTSITADQAATANANAVAAQNALNTLNPQIDAINSNITTINTQIATVQQLQSEALSVSSAADVGTLSSDYAVAQSSVGFLSQSDVTTAQQNRATLQSQMAALNASTQTGLSQCRAFGH